MAGTFRLQQVLEHKRGQEEAKTLELATLAAEHRRTQDDLRALREKQVAQLRALQGAKAGAIDPSGLEAALGYLDAIEGWIVRQTELVTAIEDRVLGCRGELIAILKEKQLLEKLEHQHATEQRGAETRRENGQIDEIAAQRFARSAASGAAEAG